MITILAIYRNLIFVISNSATVYLCVCVRARARLYTSIYTKGNYIAQITIISYI